MASTTAPTYTPAAAGNVRASAALAASATETITTALDFSAVFEGQVHILNTPGGSVSATRGLRCEFKRRYGSTPTTGESAFYTVTLPSATASTPESADVWLGTGKYALTITNLDTAQGLTVAITSDTVTNLSTATA
jgi:hypothetical protein